MGCVRGVGASPVHHRLQLAPTSGQCFAISRLQWQILDSNTWLSYFLLGDWFQRETMDMNQPAGASQSHHFFPLTWASLPCGLAVALLARVCSPQHLQRAECAEFSALSAIPAAPGHGGGGMRGVRKTWHRDGTVSHPLSQVCCGAAGRQPAQDARGSPSWGGADLPFSSLTWKGQ